MANTGTKMDLATAHAYAEKLAQWLAPFTYRITVAGSIRRRRPEVSDVEIVAIPRYQMQPTLVPGEDILGENLLWKAINKEAREIVRQGDKYTKFVTHDDVTVDVFLATSENYGLILFIRTGSAEFNIQAFIKGKEHGIKSRGGQLYKYERPVSTPEETDVFRALKRPFVRPVDREVRHYSPNGGQ